MTSSRFLKIALPLAAIPALAILLLPDSVWPVYADVLEPITLLLGSFLSLVVSFSYRRELKAAFLFLSSFLLLLALAIVLFLSFSPVLVPILRNFISSEGIFGIVQAIQFINYAMLLLFCLSILKVIDMRRLNRTGWLIFSFTTIYAVIAAVYPAIHYLNDIAALTVRILDAALIIVLVPMVWLYVQFLSSHHQQSLTFTIVIFGIVCSTIFDYLFQLILALYPGLLDPASTLRSSIPEVLFIYGYLVIVVGLYAHHKDDEWGYRTVDKILSGELQPFEEKGDTANG